jgi:tetratricopeptide (TPR) repeat protein
VTVEQTLDEAHRLLRAGRVDDAIAAYLHLLEERPDDWTTANRLGDLYVQTGQLDEAVEQFSHVARCLVERDLFAKAAALYKKVLKIVPGDESTREHLVDIAVRQRFRVDAISHLNVMAEQRRASGDDAGALEVQNRIDRLRHPVPAITLTAPEPAARPPGPDEVSADEIRLGSVADGDLVTETPTAPLIAHRPAEAHAELTTEERQRQLAFTLIENEVRAGRLKRARQLVLNVLSESSDATERVLDLAQRLMAETGDATVMCADALLEAARRAKEGSRKIEAVRALAAWVPQQPEAKSWPEGRLQRLARIDAAAGLEIPVGTPQPTALDASSERPTDEDPSGRRPSSPAPPLTSALAAAV